MASMSSRADIRRSVWEIITPEGITLTGHIAEILEKDEVLKQQQKIAMTKAPEKYLCGMCHTPVFFSEYGGSGIYFKHRPAGDNHNNQEKHKSCPFHTVDSDHPLLSQIYTGEGKWHFETKHVIASLLKKDLCCKHESVHVEQYIIDEINNTRRCPDIQFEDIEGRRWAIELTNHWMNPSVAIEREQFFRSQGITVVWLLSPDSAEKQDAIFRFVIFGMAGTLESHDRQSPHFNGFVMTPERLKESIDKGQFLMDVWVPLFSVSSSYREITYKFISHIVHFDSLSFHPNNQIPYYKNAGDDYHQALQSQKELISDDNAKEKLRLEELLFAEQTARAENLAIFSNNICELAAVTLKWSEVLKIEYLTAKKLTILLSNARKEIESLNRAIINSSQKYDVVIPDEVNRAASVLSNITKYNEELKVQEEGNRRIRMQERLAILEHDVDLLIKELSVSDSFDGVQGYNIRKKRIETVCFNISDGSHLNRLNISISEMNNKVILRNLEPIESLKYEFDFDISYRATLDKALSLVNNIPDEIRIEKIEQLFFFNINRYIDIYINSLRSATSKLYSYSIRLEPEFNQLQKIVGANRMLIKLGYVFLNTYDFQALNNLYENN
jgi:hypothetical protein